ncbi:hypothetical protein FRB95_003067 [Tulasnella sp. JGI-2019a]|nr:hypothetical protein FRB95_003067 [Tulasnella sp. JGI-2019a]
MADNLGSTSEAACGAFIRGMAIICRVGQADVDLILPVLLPGEGGVQESNMTGILIQVKSRAQAGTMVKYNIDEKNVSFFPVGENEGSERVLRPYISLVMEFGIQPSTTGLACTPTNPKPAETPNLPPQSKSTSSSEGCTDVRILAPGKQHRPPKTPLHPRYSIFAFGCSSQIYKVFEVENQASFAFLLGSRDYLNEHPCQDPEVLEQVGRGKLCFAGGKPSWGWLESEMLRLRPPEPAPPAVVTGCTGDDDD